MEQRRCSAERHRRAGRDSLPALSERLQDRDRRGAEQGTSRCHPPYHVVRPSKHRARFAQRDQRAYLAAMPGVARTPPELGTGARCAVVVRFPRQRCMKPGTRWRRHSRCAAHLSRRAIRTRTPGPPSGRPGWPPDAVAPGPGGRRISSRRSAASGPFPGRSTLRPRPSAARPRNPMASRPHDHCQGQAGDPAPKTEKGREPWKTHIPCATMKRP